MRVKLIQSYHFQRPNARESHKKAQSREKTIHWNRDKNYLIRRKEWYFYMDSLSPMNMTMDFAERMERMTPETVSMLMPHVREMTDTVSEDGMYNLTNADISRMSDDAVRRSGLSANMPVGHNSNTLNDLARALVIRELIDRDRRRRGFPFFFPFFFFPFDGRGFDHRRDFDRFRDFDHFRGGHMGGHGRL